MHLLCRWQNIGTSLVTLSHSLMFISVHRQSRDTYPSEISIVVNSQTQSLIFLEIPGQFDIVALK
jgi:hypothetical protein